MQGSREDNIICTEWLQKSFAYHIVFIIIIIIIRIGNFILWK